MAVPAAGRVGFGQARSTTDAGQWRVVAAGGYR
jgi:hypothetical protein